MAKFRDIRTLQKFASAHASIHNHFNHDRHLDRRDIFKQNRSIALAEWSARSLMGASHRSVDLTRVRGERILNATSHAPP